MSSIVEFGLYTIKDNYFIDFKSDFLVDNKAENRPNFCVVKEKNSDIVWFIPMSTQVEAYQKKIEKNEKKHGESLFYHIGKVAGKKRVFLIGNMFPVTEHYIKQPYTICNTHYVIGNKKLIHSIHKKALKYLALVKHRKLKPAVDIMSIKQELQKAK